MQIKIDQQFGFLGIDQVSGKLRIATENKDLSLDTAQPNVKVQLKTPEVQINQQRCFNDIGLKDFRTLSHETAQKAQQEALQGIARRTKEGDQLGRIQDGLSVIAMQSKERMRLHDFKDFTVKAVPSQGPEIDVKSGDVQVELTPGQVINRTQPATVKTDYQPGSLDVYLAQRPYIDISWTGQGLDMLV